MVALSSRGTSTRANSKALLEPGLILETESEESGTFTQKVVCVVGPNGNKVYVIRV